MNNTRAIKEELLKIERWERLIERIDEMVEYIKDDTQRLRRLSKKIELIMENSKQFNSEKVQELKLVLSYFNSKIEKELPENKNHVKTPENVRSLYYTSYSAWSDKKTDELINFVKNSEINSVTIDIKEVDWYVAFDMSNYKFDKIKPTSNNKIKDIKKVIEKLHDNDIYVIWRIVVFKDKLLAENRPDLAIKWSTDKKTVWTDYAWNKYMDPYSKEVWDYNINISRAAYDLWFDEINYDYVRFPSDWVISKTYYPFAKEIESQNSTRWKIMVLDKFSNYITSSLKTEFPKIVLSADVFWLVTSSDLFVIWQNLESFLLYFDYVWPMVYPSHYWEGSFWIKYPDNDPYTIIKTALSYSDKRIDELNIEIENAKLENRKVKIKEAFDAERDISSLSEIPKTKIRPWFQGFSCTRCKGYVPYNKTRFRDQVKWAKENWIESRWVWSSSNTYYMSRFNK